MYAPQILGHSQNSSSFGHRNVYDRKLFDLVQKNAQRNAEKEFIAVLPSGLRSAFDEAERIYHPDVSDLFALRIHQANEIQKLALPSTSSLVVLQTSSHEKAKSLLLHCLEVLSEGEYAVVFGRGNGVVFDDAGAWVSDLPAFLLDVSAVRKAALELHIEEIAVMSQDQSMAIILETFSGFMPEEPSADEVIYELTAWLAP